ncbi:DUF397 domain-containing protein [Nocardia sp. NEAU-G5]|uniref:DUF397 domain-containing protein n=1 Tax=Nocardia albiluteola TaxID=2842303 RepID=A0ABS6ATP0_9NOCA|nr:DUF397 domain-containing protein [Nocardia albiluteola]MBU3060945.1 DUF397 domain-containing protein [Nocardia albiluteola]
MSINLIGAQWFKSSKSRETSACVEVAFLNEDHVGVRDSKNPTGPALIFAPAEWDAFTADVRDGGLDHA